jgi:hypothetical protein
MDLYSCLGDIGGCLFDERGQVALSIIGTCIVTIIGGAWVLFTRKPADAGIPSQLTSEHQNTNQVTGGDQSVNQVNNINATGDSRVSVQQKVK